MNGGGEGPTDLLELMNSTWMSQAVYVAAKLGIADALSERSLTSTELARRLRADPDSLHRLLRALASLGLCDELDDRSFGLTPLGESLRSGVDGSLRSYAIHWGGSMWPAWGGLLHHVRTGRNPRALVTGKGTFESLAGNPEAARVFNDAMAEVSRIVAAGVVRVCDFAGIERLVDVGGGSGELLATILKARPSMRGTLFDRPAALEDARSVLEAAGVAERCDVVPGSFFDAVPGPADACLMKSVLHDWSDDRARAILESCHRAVAGRGRVIVVERVLPERMQPTAADRFMVSCDLAMMVAAGGRERTEADFRALLESAGFRLSRRVDAAAYFSVLEGRCA